MTMADELKFEENDGIANGLLAYAAQLESSDRVILQHAGKRIHVDDIHKGKEGTYEGHISCFETGGASYPVLNEQTKEPYLLKKDYQFSFRLKHVFACIK